MADVVVALTYDDSGILASRDRVLAANQNIVASYGITVAP